MAKKIRLFSPATVANVACGFDIFGFALDTPGDELLVTLTDHSGVTIEAITGDGGVLSLDPEKNVAAVTAHALLEKVGEKTRGAAITLHKQMPLGSGLGSSAASAAGSLYALNLLLGSPLTTEELVPLAMEGERIACGSAHADNVAPALMGGFVLIRSYSPLDIVRVPVNIPLFCAIVHPSIELLTRDARACLPETVTMRQMVEQTGNAAALIAALMLGDRALLSRSLHDSVVEPCRAKLVPGFAACKAAALEAGAIGCSLSGSGPSIFALCSSSEEAAKAAKAMAAAIEREGLAATVYISRVNMTGPKILGEA
jgi:homoserine kinase